MTDHNITKSTSLPADLEVKALLTKGTPSEKARLVTVIYAPSSIDYDQLETFADVMDSHGVVVLYNEERDNFNIDQWYRDVLTERSNTQSVIVNDSNAIGVDGDPARGKISKLIFHDGRTQIQLVTAAYTLSDLIQIASTSKSLFHFYVVQSWVDLTSKRSICSKMTSVQLVSVHII